MCGAGETPVYKIRFQTNETSIRALYYTLPATVVSLSHLGRTEHLFTQTPKKSTKSPDAIMTVVPPSITEVLQGQLFLGK